MHKKTNLMKLLRNSEIMKNKHYQLNLKERKALNKMLNR